MADGGWQTGPASSIGFLDSLWFMLCSSLATVPKTGGRMLSRALRMERISYWHSLGQRAGRGIHAQIGLVRFIGDKCGGDGGESEL
jgi:hypothetical protein